MADGLTPGYLRRRARYWRERAAKATDRDKQIRLRQTAEILEREAEARALERRQQLSGRAPTTLPMTSKANDSSQPAGIDWLPYVAALLYTTSQPAPARRNPGGVFFAAGRLPAAALEAPAVSDPGSREPATWGHSKQRRLNARIA
jgi:hypothetical protein